MAAFSKILTQDMPDLPQVSYRPPAVAGSFYPNNPDSLKMMLNEYLDGKEFTPISGDILAIVVPHAGYVFSGWVAGKAYREIRNRKYDAIIIIGPSHAKYFTGASVFKGDGYTTPLGEVPVDKNLANEIANYSPLVKLSLDGHGWKGNESEHSIEVQIPFLQMVQPNVPIVPIDMGSQDFATCDALVKSIVYAVRNLNKKILVVASSDLSHFHDQNTAVSLDSFVVNSFSKFDYFKLETNLFAGKWEACGGGPIVAAMMIAEQLGANATLPFQYATSANSPYVQPNKDRVVGYMSGAVYNDNSGKQNILPEINDNDKKLILEIAEITVQNSVLGKPKKKLPEENSSYLNEEYAAFVTLKEHGELRGCIGQIFSKVPLRQSIQDAARNAALRDPRFNAVSEAELSKLEYEVTVLSRMKKILDEKEIVIGRDGVYMKSENSSAIFLPQVAPEQHWDVKDLLENLCRKAGIARDSYKLPDTEIFIFQALIIK
ncbi:MAG: AmmeMemoRadiSam system protein B [FCB group bacterium]